jgi:hypothetical protein
MVQNHFYVVTVAQLFKKFSILNVDPHIQYLLPVESTSDQTNSVQASRPVL